MTAAVYQIAKAQTPRRDIDLFGPTTVRIDRAGAPVLYLSAYVEDPDRLATRIVGALAWLDDNQSAQRVADGERDRARDAEDTDPQVVAPAYALPGFVEDVDYTETLTLPEDVTTTDWKAWSEAVLCRIRLATTAGQLAAMEAANAAGLRLCPFRFRTPIGKALNDAYLVTQDQAA